MALLANFSIKYYVTYFYFILLCFLTLKKLFGIIKKKDTSIPLSEGKIFWLFVTSCLFLFKFSMADRSGSQSSVVITMKVATTPEAHLAFTNLAYCSPSDLSQFAILGTNFFLANVADVFTLSLSYPFFSLQTSVLFFDK